MCSRPGPAVAIYAGDTYIPRYIFRLPFFGRREELFFMRVKRKSPFVCGFLPAPRAFRLHLPIFYHALIFHFSNAICAVRVSLPLLLHRLRWLFAGLIVLNSLGRLFEPDEIERYAREKQMKHRRSFDRIAAWVRIRMMQQKKKPRIRWISINRQSPWGPGGPECRFNLGKSFNKYISNWSWILIEMI